MEKLLESCIADNEMTRYAFLSHMEAYIKQLLTNPQGAYPDDFLLQHGIDGPKALKMLLTPSDPSDETTAILIRTEKIRPEEISEEESAEGKIPKDKFYIKYKLPRKDFFKKMRNLYIRLFENTDSNDTFLTEMNANDLPELSKVTTKKEKKNEITYYFGKNGWGLTDELAKISKKIEKLSKTNNVYIKDTGIDTLDDCYSITIELRPITEGAWGYGILDNDSALDKQTSFGIHALQLLSSRITMSKTDDERWSNIGVMVDFLKKYDHDELRFTDEYNMAIETVKNVARDLHENEAFLKSWSDPTKIKSELRRIYRDVVNISYDKNRLNEDGEGGTMAGMGGATNASSSGQYTTPLFGKPLKKKSVYFTEEQVNYIKKALNEDSPCVMDTRFGDFGYDANPFLMTDDPTLDHKDMIKNSIMEDEVNMFMDFPAQDKYNKKDQEDSVKHPFRSGIVNEEDDYQDKSGDLGWYDDNPLVSKSDPSFDHSDMLGKKNNNDDRHVFPGYDGKGKREMK